MATEIERKFLVGDVSFLGSSAGAVVRQGYLSLDPDRTVRVRVADGSGFLTVKGRSDGASRPEFEYAIPREDADELLALRDGALVEKVRHRVEHGGRTWEVDVFGGENAGLVVAEVELPTADALVALPPWVGREVTGDERFFNASLVRHPYRSWPESERR
jgi:CYTH domain-containing protein